MLKKGSFCFAVVLAAVLLCALACAEGQTVDLLAVASPYQYSDTLTIYSPQIDPLATFSMAGNQYGEGLSPYPI